MNQNTYSAPPAQDERCSKQIDDELRAILQSDKKGILARQLQLTTVKLALETRKSERVSVEEYLKKEFESLGSLDESGTRAKLLSLYEKNRFPIDTKKLDARIREANYFKRSLRLKNEELSLYVLAHKTLNPEKSVYDRMDAAILWYQSQIADKSTAKPGSAEYNLLQASTGAGIYLGFMQGVKKWSLQELEERLSYFKEAASKAFHELSQELILRIDPKCKSEMSCFDCSVKPEALEDRFAALIQGTKNALETVDKEKSTESGPTPAPTGVVVKKQESTSSSSHIQVELDSPIVVHRTDENMSAITVKKVSPPQKSTVVLTPTPTMTATPEPTPIPTQASTSGEVSQQISSGAGFEAVYQYAASQALKQAPLSRAAFERAYKGWSKIKKEQKGIGDRVMVVDFDTRGDRPRAYLINMKTGQIILQAHTSHARNSDQNPNDGYPEDFSNKSGSEKSSVGFFRIENTHHYSPNYSKYGPAMSLQGIDGELNSNSYSGSKNGKAGREIIVHGVPHAVGFESMGCFIFSSEESLGQMYGAQYKSRTTKSILEEVQANMSSGDLIFAYSSRSNQDSVSKWLK